MMRHSPESTAPTMAAAGEADLEDLEADIAWMAWKAWKAWKAGGARIMFYNFIIKRYGLYNNLLFSIFF